MELVMNEKIFVFGAGGHAKVVIDVIEKQGIYKPVCLFDDDDSLKGTEFYGHPVVGGRKELISGRDSLSLHKCIIAVGDNRTRMKIAEWILVNDFELVTAVHSSSQLARGVTLGPNTVLMAGTIVNSDAAVGASVIINTAATVDHDCLIRDGVHIAPGSHLCGNVIVGEGAFLGAGTIVTPGVNIGEHAIVGAGSVVVSDIPGHVTARGVPCAVSSR
jgi:sugar O-acyltransferase (sialic acid O-acetyltransferase NeuD family)